MMDKRRLGIVASLLAGGILLLGSLGTASAQMVGQGGSGMMGGGSTGGYSGSGMMGGVSGGYSAGGGMMSGAGAGAMMSLDDARAAMLQYMTDQGLDYMSLSGMVRGDQGYLAMMVDPDSGSPIGGLMVDGSGNVSQVSLDMMGNLDYGGMMSGR